MDDVGRFTVCVLLYGDHAALARRCLGPLLGLCPPARLRVWANAPGRETEEYLCEAGLPGRPGTSLRVSLENVLKYPAMRALFHDPPLTTEFVTWFDDDSFVTDPDPAAWLGRVAARLDAGEDMVGPLLTTPYFPGQEDWRRENCSWDRGVPTGGWSTFAAGGWWAVRASVVGRFDWPDRGLRHRGGDVLFGELFRQQGLRLGHFRDGVAVNADEDGEPDAAPRRGHDEFPVGSRLRSAGRAPDGRGVADGEDVFMAVFLFRIPLGWIVRALAEQNCGFDLVAFCRAARYRGRWAEERVREVLGAVSRTEEARRASDRAVRVAYEAEGRPG